MFSLHGETEYYKDAYIYAIQHNSIQTPDENCLGMAEYGG